MKKNMLRYVLALVSISLFVIPKTAFADGMIMPPPHYYIYEQEQKAVIWYDNGVETLILSTTFSGNAREFGWIIPTPSRPEMGIAKDELFVALNDLTQPTYDEPVTYRSYGLLDTANLEKSVTVLETKKVDVYDLVLLEASDSGALAKWLSDNGFNYPTSEATILESYITRGWYFVAAKINTDSLSSSTTQNQLKEGHAAPIKLTFKASNIVYPLRISSIVYEPQSLIRYPYDAESQQTDQGEMSNGSSGMTILPPDDQEDLYYPIQWQEPPETVKVTLYVFADNKQTATGFDTQFASKVSKKNIQNLSADDLGRPWVQATKSKYLTRLERSMTTAEMSDDVLLRNASDNRAVNAPFFLGFSDGWVIFFALVTVGVEVGAISFVIKRTQRNKPDKGG